MRRVPLLLALALVAGCEYVPDLGLGSLGGQEAQAAAVTLSPEEVDDSCILAADEELWELTQLKGEGRALPAPLGEGSDPASERIVEIDTTDAGSAVTYVFACVVDEQGEAATEALGRRRKGSPAASGR